MFMGVRLNAPCEAGKPTAREQDGPKREKGPPVAQPARATRAMAFGAVPL